MLQANPKIKEVLINAITLSVVLKNGIKGFRNRFYYKEYFRIYIKTIVRLAGFSFIDHFSAFNLFNFALVSGNSFNVKALL